jgi:serine/threonine protein kinase
MLVGPDRSHVKLVDFGLATRLSHNPDSEADSNSDSNNFSNFNHKTSKKTLPSPVNGISKPSRCIDKQLTRFCGTPHYMAPEICMREPYG